MRNEPLYAVHWRAFIGASGLPMFSLYIPPNPFLSSWSCRLLLDIRTLQS